MNESIPAGGRVATAVQVGAASQTMAHGVAEARSLFDKQILAQALGGSIKKLDPRVQVKNPVMFVVLVGTVITLIEALAHPGKFAWFITIWLFLTVIFANFAEAMAEGRGKAQADTLRRMRSETEARRLNPDGTESRVAAVDLAKGDHVICEANDLIPSDGEIIEGIASVDESAITGESAPVIRESGGDRSAVTGGTKVLSDRIVVQITAERGHTFLDRMIHLVEGANRQKTPNEIALTILLAVLTIVFLPVVVVLQPFGHFAGATVSVVILVSLLVCLIPTTIGALLSAIGIAGMDRLVQRNVLAMSGRAVEAAGDVQTLLLDKTGTITLGNRMASAFIPAAGHNEEELAEAAQLASLADETPEGRSIVVLAKDRFNIRERDLGTSRQFIPFSATTRMSSVDFDGRQIRKGAAESVRRWATELGSRCSSLGEGRSLASPSVHACACGARQWPTGLVSSPGIRATISCRRRTPNELASQSRRATRRSSDTAPGPALERPYTTSAAQPRCRLQSRSRVVAGQVRSDCMGPPLAGSHHHGSSHQLLPRVRRPLPTCPFRSTRTAPTALTASRTVGGCGRESAPERPWCRSPGRVGDRVY